MNTKYNYVFFNIDDPCYEPVLWPLKKNSFVKLYKHALKTNKLTDKLFFLHWSAKLNRKVHLPFKKAWFPKIVKQNFENNKPCVYVFLGGKYLTEEKGLYEYIKSINPQNKAVVLCGDLISKKNWDMDNIKNLCDMVLTYDEGEAEKFGISYFPWGSLYDAIDEVTTPECFENDIYFLGFAKDRLKEIHSAYKTFSDKGLKCKFIICGTDEKDRIQGDGLCYSLPIAYRENLRNIKASRCILEVIQGGSYAPTLRLREAYTYKRKLITNNSNPEYRDYLDSKNLLVYENSEQINPEFAKTPVDYTGFKAVHNSPLALIEFFENHL